MAFLFAGIFHQKSKMANNFSKVSLQVASFNCRSVKNSFIELKELCNRCDFVFLQEHWLLPFELSLLNDIHVEFLGTGQSSVDLSEGVLIGRPYGGTAILYKKSFSHYVQHIETFDPRLTAVKFDTNIGPILFVCAYMPNDVGDEDCLECYIDTCSRISALYSDPDIVHAIVAGDFNCSVGTRFYNAFVNCAADNKFMLSDLSRLVNAVTYCSDDGKRTSWIDHVLCSHSIDDMISSVQVLDQFISSDHKPILINFNDIYCQMAPNVAVNAPSGNSVVYDWDKASPLSISRYRDILSTSLDKVNIPIVALQHDSVANRQLINDYYDNIVASIRYAVQASIPFSLKNHCKTDYVIAGWNEVVKDKHLAARAAFLDWVSDGKPRFGPTYGIMARTRASFKLALRYCKHHEESLRADAFASKLAEKDFKSFWRSISKHKNSSSTIFVNVVEGCSGDFNIAEMWRKYFDHLYNCVDDGGFKQLLCDRIDEINSSVGRPSFIINVQDLLSCMRKQKTGKAVGSDDIAMEAFINGGQKLAVHLCILFNLFIQCSYLPPSFMHSVIIPLVKNKSGDLSSADNYRAIAISTAISKLFEGVVASEVYSYCDTDKYQFGFKKGHSTTLCTDVLKKTVDYYVNRGSYVFACFIDFSKAFDRVNYWKLFNKLLDDGINSGIVAILAFWYSNQLLCVRWQNTVSCDFSVGNGTRQGSLLSPFLFSRYIRELLLEISSSGNGCNVGGLFINILAYADDIVLLAPTWAALQKLLSVMEKHIIDIDMSCNVKKTVCMIFEPKRKSSRISGTFPQFKFGDSSLNYVERFKYLGHFIADTLCDDFDIQREIRNLFTRSNILARRFAKCSIDVKVTLFKAYCINLYDAGLWRNYSKGTLSKLLSCYHKCIKFVFGFKRRDSITGLLFELGLPSFNTIIHNSAVIVSRSLFNSCNPIVCHLKDILSDCHKFNYLFVQ